MNIQDIVEKCKNGDNEAWNMIIDKYSKTIYNLALNFFGNKENAEDITQDIFLKVYNNITKFREEKNFNSWILRISKNYCIDYWRKNKKYIKRAEFDENLLTQDHTPEDEIIKDFDIKYLRNKMLNLDPELRSLLILRDIQEFSYQEIADMLNLPLGTIKSRINRARVKLAKIFLEEGN